MKVPRFPIYALPSQSLPHYHYAHHSGTFLIKDEPTLTHHYHPQAIVYLTVHSWFVHSMSLDKHITHISIINVLYRVSSLPWKFSVLTLFLTPSSISNLTLPACHIVGVILYATFSDGLLLLCNMHVWFFHVFSWLENPFIFFFLFFWPHYGTNGIWPGIESTTSALEVQVLSSR